MKSALISFLLALVGAGGAAAQQFTFLDRDTDEYVVWSFENGEEQRIDLNFEPTCGAGTRRILTGGLTNPITGVMIFKAAECAGDGSGFSGNDEYWFVNTLTGEVEVGQLDPRIANLSDRVLNSRLTYFGNTSALSEQMNESIEASSAIASALEIQLPVNGESNRVGLTNGAFGDELAFGVSYARVQGNFDVGFAYAQGDGGRNAGKVSVGFSW